MTRSEKARARLAAIEQEFRDLLIAALQECSRERTALFLTSERARRFGMPGLVRPEHKQLMELGREIEKVRERLNEPPFELFKRFLHYCNFSGSNDLGDARRAKLLLNEITPAEEPN